MDYTGFPYKGGCFGLFSAFTGTDLSKLGYTLGDKLFSVIRMRCVLCNSHRLINFIDGFGDKRVFCRSCGRSYLEGKFDAVRSQRNLQDFGLVPDFKVYVPQHFGV